MIRRAQSGDTLVEVVLSIAILSVVLVSAFNIANLAFRVGVQARERTEASQIAQKHAEIMIASRDAALQSTPLPGTLFSGGNFTDHSVNEGPGGRYSVVVDTTSATRTDGTASTPMLNTIITVKWDSVISGPAGGTNSLALQLNLADLRDLHPIDCSVKGVNSLCTL